MHMEKGEWQDGSDDATSWAVSRHVGHGVVMWHLLILDLMSDRMCLRRVHVPAVLSERRSTSVRMSIDSSLLM